MLLGEVAALALRLRDPERAPEALQHVRLQAALLGHLGCRVARLALEHPLHGKQRQPPLRRGPLQLLELEPVLAEPLEQLQAAPPARSPSSPSSSPSASKSIATAPRLSDRARRPASGPVPTFGRRDRQGRAADHRPRPARARSTTGSASELEGVAVGSMLVVPFGRRRTARRGRGASPSGATCRRSGSWSRSRRSRATCRRSSSGSGCGWPREYCSTPARGLALVLPPGTGTGADAAGRRRSRRDAHRAGCAALDGRPSGWASASAPCSRRSPTGLARRRPSSATRTLRRPRAAGARGAQRGALTRARRARDAGGGRPRRGARRLTGAPAAALDAIERRLDAGGEPLLLHGVTGSGKTEVYLRAGRAALERGRSAIVLVPEIALTPQTAGRFASRFGDTVAVLHSRLSAARALRRVAAAARAARRASASGPRSAVFAPARRPRPDRDRRGARRLLQAGGRPPLRRPPWSPSAAPRRRGAVLLAGSATPRPESHARATTGSSCPSGSTGAALPPVELVGMLGRRRAAAPAHPRCARRRAPAAREGDRAAQPPRLVELPLLPRLRRASGSAPTATSRSCSTARPGEVACHHCGQSERVPAACPDCGSASVARHGAGTERLEAELERAGRAAARVPARRRHRRRRPRHRRRCCGASSGADAGVLVGTQMVAKGHDFPDVTLGVVLDADATLRFPDFRAEERTFALVAQLAGRSGRGARGGRVIVQALDPEARALRHAAHHDSEGFLARRAGAPRGALLPAVRQPRPRRLLVARRPGRRPRRRRRCASGSPGPARCSARRRCSGARAGTGRSSWSSRPSVLPRSPRCEPRCRRSPATALTAASASLWMWIRNDGVELPLARHAPQLGAAAIVELDPRARRRST